MSNPDFTFNAMRLLDSRVNEVFESKFSYFYLFKVVLSSILPIVV